MFWACNLSPERSPEELQARLSKDKLRKWAPGGNVTSVWEGWSGATLPLRQPRHAPEPPAAP